MELKYRFFLSIILSVFFLETTASSLDSLRLENQNGRTFVVHEVEKGETLYSLSRRYQTEVSEIVRFNNILDNTISLNQILFIPISIAVAQDDSSNNEVGKEKKDDLLSISPEKQEEGDSIQVKAHTVKPKETLYSISKIYGIKVKELKEWNNLTDNSLSLGQELVVSKASKIIDELDVLIEVENANPGFNEYLVQNGDMIETIAGKFNVRPDSIMVWNKLANSYLAIGQRLLIKGEIDSLAQMVKPKIEDTGYSQKSKLVDSSGFSRILEEGVAKKIDDIIDTDKYLAMHRTLEIGTMIEVRNLMNNKKIFVRIVGKLPATGINENTLIRLTPICFERLGVIDPKARVQISYYED